MYVTVGKLALECRDAEALRGVDAALDSCPLEVLYVGKQDNDCRILRLACKTYGVGDARRAVYRDMERLLSVLTDCSVFIDIKGAVFSVNAEDGDDVVEIYVQDGNVFACRCRVDRRACGDATDKVRTGNSEFPVGTLRYGGQK